MGPRCSCSEHRHRFTGCTYFISFHQQFSGPNLGTNPLNKTSHTLRTLLSAPGLHSFIPSVVHGRMFLHFIMGSYDFMENFYFM